MLRSVGCLYLFFLCQSLCRVSCVHAENYWSCTNHSRPGTTITNVASGSVRDDCKPLSLERAPFNKISREMFSQFGLARAEPDESESERKVQGEDVGLDTTSVVRTRSEVLRAHQQNVPGRGPKKKRIERDKVFGRKTVKVHRFAVAVDELKQLR